MFKKCLLVKCNCLLVFSNLLEDVVTSIILWPYSLCIHNYISQNVFGIHFCIVVQVHIVRMSMPVLLQQFG